MVYRYPLARPSLTLIVLTFIIGRFAPLCISHLMGHEPIKETVRYLGLEFVNMQNVMKEYVRKVPIFDS
jgi:hypothetical protein